MQEIALDEDVIEWYIANIQLNGNDGELGNLFAKIVTSFVLVSIIIYIKMQYLQMRLLYTENYLTHS
jgi:hypothetical protein